MDEWILHFPFVSGSVERGSIAQTARTVHFAEGVYRSNYCVALSIVWDSTLQGQNHGNTGDGRVNGQEDVVEYNKRKEYASLANRPRLIVSPPIVPVQEEDGRRVYGCDGQGDPVVQSGIIRLEGYWKGILEGRAMGWRRYQRRRRVGWKLENRPGGQVACDEGWTRAGHDVVDKRLLNVKMCCGDSDRSLRRLMLLVRQEANCGRSCTPYVGWS